MLESTDTLWRYMKLSTFLLLLEGKVWFPSVASLHAGDPLEGELGVDHDDLLWDALGGLGKLEETQQWLREHSPQSTLDHIKLNNGDPNLESHYFANLYIEEMARRRAVWCWFAGDLESAAMWGTYGHQGLAIRTSRERLASSLPAGKQFRIEPISYVIRRQMSERSISATVLDRPDAILYPHLLKAMEFEHEKETRVVAFCPEDENGVMVIGIDAKALIHEVVISPLLPSAEASALKRLIQSRLDNGSRIRRSSLIGRRASNEFSDAFEQAFYGSTDENVRLADVPAVYRTL
jgi:hypothetical protein